MRLTKNFTLAELCVSGYARRNNIDNTPSEQEIQALKQLAENSLQPVRDYLGEPIIVTSAYRNEEVNKAVGGTSNSQHLRGQAADIKLRSQSQYGTFHLFSTIAKHFPNSFDQLILEFHNYSMKDTGWVHISYNSPIRNRGQILVYDKVDNRTVARTLRFNSARNAFFEYTEKMAFGALPISK